MIQFADLVCKARKAAYVRWLALAQMGVRCFILSTIVVAFFSVIPMIQSVKYGVLLLAGVLFLIMRSLYAIFDRYEGIRPIDYSSESFNKTKKLAHVAVLMIPITISWITNGSFHGAINPVGYWNEELAQNGEGKCAVLGEVLAGSVDEFRVTQNKFKMGIATTSDLKRSAQVLEAFSKSHEKCIHEAANRVEEAEKRLTELNRK